MNLITTSTSFIESFPFSIRDLSVAQTFMFFPTHTQSFFLHPSDSGKYLVDIKLFTNGPVDVGDAMDSDTCSVEVFGTDEHQTDS